MVITRWTLPLVLSGLLAAPAWSQTPTPEEPDPALDLTELEILQACAEDRAGSLPNPFSDVQPTDWAYAAVLTLYYCGAYRGAIPPEQYLKYLANRREAPRSPEGERRDESQGR